MELELNLTGAGVIRSSRPETQSGVVTDAEFAALFDTYKDRVYSIALRFTADHAVALDIAQETFLKLYSSLNTFRGEAAFDSWLFKIVVNRCLDYQRRKRRWLPFLDDIAGRVDALLGAPQTPTALEDLLKQEMQSQVQRTIARLAPELRIVIVLRYTENLAYEDIAEILGCPLGTVASRLNRAHKILERRLSHLNTKPANKVHKIRRTRNAQ